MLSSCVFRESEWIYIYLILHLLNVQHGTHLDQTGKLIKYSDFVNKELILFSMVDLQRSIPSMVDGLKPGQRKILFCSFKELCQGSKSRLVFWLCV